MKKLGFNRKSVLERFEEIDGDHINEFGYLPARYEKTMFVTYREFAKGSTGQHSKQVLRAIRSAGRIVANRVPKLIPGCKALLYWIKREGYTNLLLTRGVYDLQMKKLRTNRIAHYFNAVKVVSSKTKKEFRDAIRAVGFRPDEAWVVGDSVKSDINPGLEIGCDCILYLYRHESYSWRQEHGEAAIGQHYVVSKLSEIPKVISSPEQYHKVTYRSRHR
jgi:putative hydrolase of the HAD superfamily